jgi:hypothetical protein
MDRGFEDYGSDGDDSPGALGGFAARSAEWVAAPAEHTRARTPPRVRATSGTGGGGGGGGGVADRGVGGAGRLQSPRRAAASPRLAMTPARAELRDYTDTHDVRLEDPTTFPHTPPLQVCPHCAQG